MTDKELFEAYKRTCEKTKSVNIRGQTLDYEDIENEVRKLSAATQNNPPNYTTVQDTPQQLPLHIHANSRINHFREACERAFERTKDEKYSDIIHELDGIERSINESRTDTR